MSHYAVAVIHKENQDIDEMLDRYSEHLEVEPYIYRTKQEVIEEAQFLKERMVEQNRQHEEWFKPYLEAETDEEFYRAEVGSSVDEEGNELSTYNPDSKWDWYQVGGRWGGLLKSRVDGEFYDELPMTEIDFSRNEEEYKDALEEWDDIIAGKTFYRPEYYLETYGTKEEYARRVSEFSTYAILTPEDEWIEPGKMGWFGVSNASSEDKKKYEEGYMDIINRYMSDEYIMTIVDCHI